MTRNWVWLERAFSFGSESETRRFFFAYLVVQCSFLEAATQPYLAPSSTDSFRSPIHFESDSLDYRENDQVITATGNVKVQQSSFTFYSDYAVFNIPEQGLSAWGNVRFTDVKGDEIHSRFISYQAETGKAQLLDAQGSFGSWIFAAEKAERDGQGNYFLQRARLSTCETDLSKYHLYGYKIKVFPGKSLAVQNAIFRVGPVPVLYLPYYYYPLGQRQLSFQFFPGSNQSEGAFVRTIWGYPYSQDSYARVYLDYLSRRGVGTGGEFDYYVGDQMKGSFYGYHIQDNIAQQERWNVRLSHWQKLSSNMIFQTNANRLSDDQFPNDFFREDFNRVVRDMRSNTALTYQKKNNLLRIFAERTDLFDPLSNKFYAQDVSAPRVEFNQRQSSLGFGKIDKILSFSATNRFAGTSFEGQSLSRDYRRESDAQATFLRSFNVIPRNTSFTPKLTIENFWTDMPQQAEGQDPFLQKVTGQGILRQKLSRWSNIDLTYNLTQRLENNTGDDQGIEDHSLSVLSSIRPSNSVSIRLDTAHNLPRNKGDPLVFLEPKNYRPLRGEISFDPERNLEFFFREEYSLYDSLTGSMHPLSTQSELVLGQRTLGQDYYSIATTYKSSTDNQFELRQSVRWNAFKTWKLEGTLRTFLFYTNTNVFSTYKAQFVEEDIFVRKEWRCWDFSFQFRERTGVIDFLFNLELKLDRVNREKTTNTHRESEFYPWRETHSQ